MDQLVVSLNNGHETRRQSGTATTATSVAHPDATGAEEVQTLPPKSNNGPSSLEIDDQREIKAEQKGRPASAEYVYLCIRQKRHKIKLVPEDIRLKGVDQDAFTSIRSAYQANKASWWRLNTLSHVEFKRVSSTTCKPIHKLLIHTQFRMYQQDYVDISEGEEEMPICGEKCKEGCGNGCIGYWYSPARIEMMPPIPKKAMVELLESPECFATKNWRAALPKRHNPLHLGQLHLQDGWGLDFKDEVCSWPIVSVQVLAIVAAIVVAISFGVEDEKRLSSVLSGGFILAIGQSVATLMQKWAERNLGETPKVKEKG